jgi:DNA repair protein RadC
MFEAGKLLGIDLVDHIVIARRGFVSMRDRNLGFA